jgi:hypothetical protein
MNTVSLRSHGGSPHTPPHALSGRPYSGLVGPRCLSERMCGGLSAFLEGCRSSEGEGAHLHLLHLDKLGFLYQGEVCG